MEYFKINNIDVGFSENTTVYIAQGKFNICLQTPELKFTKELHNDFLVDEPSFILENGLKLSALEFSLPTAKLDFTQQFPYRDNANYLQQLRVDGLPNHSYFFGTLSIHEGWLELKGNIQEDYEKLSEKCIPINIIKSFKLTKIIPNRSVYTLGEAKAQNALEVYQIGIKKGQFKTFPESILSYKNLESLVFFMNAQTQFTEFPEALCQLHQLHTLQLFSYSKLESLPAQFNNLKNLELLSLRGNFKEVPKAIKELKNLSSLDLSGNLLETIPDWLAELPNLRQLNLKYNRFSSLPENLNTIHNLSIDAKFLPLFQDQTYTSNNLNPITESLYNFENKASLKAILETAIDAIPELTYYKAFLLKYCQPNITATAILTEKLPIGTSKFGGAPDLPKNIPYPKNTNGELYIFHAQINLKDIAHLQAYLPKIGMLYFFVNDEEYAQKPMVIYHETDTNLLPFSYDNNTFADLDYEIRKTYFLQFHEGISFINTYNIGNYWQLRAPHFAHLFSKYEDDYVLNEYCEIVRENVVNTLSKNRTPIKVPLVTEIHEKEVETSEILYFNKIDETNRRLQSDKSKNHEFKLEEFKIIIKNDTVLLETFDAFSTSFNHTLTIIAQEKDLLIATKTDYMGLHSFVLDRNKDNKFASYNIQAGDYSIGRFLKNITLKDSLFINNKTTKTTVFPNAIILADLPFSQHEVAAEKAAVIYKGKPQDWFTLLTVNSFSNDVNIWDAGTLSYNIHKKDLEILDFSKLVTSIESH